MNELQTATGNKIFSWCPNIEDTAKEQIENIADQPYTKHCALMPDAHAGMSMPIGGVVACDNVVVPNFVGVDIGCGMGALVTSLHRKDLDDQDVRDKTLHSFSRSIPVGFSHNTDKRRKELARQYESQFKYIVSKTKVEDDDHNPIGDFEKSFFSQLGTLGGGNHFLEVQYDQDDNVWVMIHSGSRNMGKKVGDYFNDLAKTLNEAWYSDADRAIPFLPTSTAEGKSYLRWMDFALRFAYLNRKVMLDAVKKDLEHVFPTIKFMTKASFEDHDIRDNIINIHHNFATLENHMGKNYWVHRKGATRAFENTLGIIPGSMGTSSYIVMGKGERLSLMSCSHGAGRKMGRMAFCREMKDRMDEIEESLDGVTHSKFSTIERGKMKGVLDVSEAPQAYKDIDEVINNELDLIEPLFKLKPLISMKG